MVIPRNCPARLVAFYDTLGIRRTYSHVKLPESPLGHGIVLKYHEHNRKELDFKIRNVHALVKKNQ